MSIVIGMAETQSSDTSLSGAAGRLTAEQRLREALLAGRLAPGHRLVETELAEQFGVNRSSVHFALRALETDGLVERIPHRGARVRFVSISEAVGILECRQLLDGLITRKAAENATDQEATLLDGNRRRMRDAIAGHDFVKYSDLIQEHHRLIRTIGRHPIATAIEERLQWQIIRHQFRLSLRPERAEESLREIEAVVDAVIGHDPAEAEAASHRHFRGVIAAVLREATKPVE
ncbi:GntR family transcriptional regulator [Actinoplanes sp. RD1]|uniref:GntR family transcriptional regulator n=1 Tax=Actinoplanes sp. RD1 TaxID=3064538 RepID=UPI00274088F1|nr:GntR family transcriptional regulator [Actinoplanes sp. RD1]